MICDAGNVASLWIQPLSICDECFSPLEVVFDLEYARTRFTREAIPAGTAEYVALSRAAARGRQLRAADSSGVNPLMKAPRLGAHIGASNLFIKNDAVCLPTLSFKDRVVAVALANAQPSASTRLAARPLAIWPTPWLAGRAVGSEDIHPRPG